MNVTVLAVGGTGESHVDDRRTEVTGMLAGVTDALDERFTSRWVPYPASYGPVTGRGDDCYSRSVAVGVANLADAIEVATNPVMLIGYSQGAAVIRTLLAHPSAAHLHAKVRAVGLVADPHQPPGVVAGCYGWGVAGPGPELPGHIPAYWIGASEDVICNASPDSLVRDVADLTDTMSVRHLPRWLGDVWKRAFGAATQNAAVTRFTPHQWARDTHRLAIAGREVVRYLFGGRHVSYSAEPYRVAPLTDPDVTGCELLAHHLQVEATLRSSLRSMPAPKVA